jgi:glycosyltransferase involved in cell wall biosynthesis
MDRKIRIAFIKYGGLSVGGSEKLAQNIAAFLPKDRFEVDFFACDSGLALGPTVGLLSTSPERVKFLEDHAVRVIKFRVGARDLRTYTHEWKDTNFWEIFNEDTYDLIQTSRSGHKEYPFYKIKRTPIVDILNLNAGVDNQFNIARVVHLSRWNANKWTHKGGDPSRVVVISLPVWIPHKEFGNFREELNLRGKFVFGMHQRADNAISSLFPLAAYKKIEDENTAFVMLGGGDKYKQQASELGLKNIHFIQPNVSQETVYKFLNTLNVFAHGRKDGEINSMAMAEALYFGLPIVSHPSEINNGHIECIANAGRVVMTVDEYAAELRHLRDDKNYYAQKSAAAKSRFAENYEPNGQINRIINIYEDVIKNPFPDKFRRRLYALHYTQNIRIWLAKLYLILKYRLGFKNLKKG